MLETFFELHPSSRSQGTFLFFEEIQEVPDWDIAARRIVDTEKITMYVAGSSSRMLSTDVATEFRGRSIAYELIQVSPTSVPEHGKRSYAPARSLRAARSHGTPRKERRNHSNARRRIQHQCPRRSYPSSPCLEVVAGINETSIADDYTRNR